jgi:dihydroorotate dehydrogenase electron transfer subunit
MTIDKPLVLPIQKIVQENSRVKSFYFDYPLVGKPGQFVMLWIPGFDELPFGIINKNNSSFMISAAAVGEATQALHAMKTGDKVGVRGAYGTSFSFPKPNAKVAMVAGGYGMVPLAYLAQELRKKNISVDLFAGARTKSELLFDTWMEEIGVTVHRATDDGSIGHKGFVTEPFAKYVETAKPDMVYIVGPEVMEKKISDICYNLRIPFQISLERYMKCGIGICGQCCVDPTGWRMCVEGPVLNHRQLKLITEFGVYHRTASGRILK